MGIFDGCLLVSDVDGTLISENRVPQRNIDGIKRFIEGGGKFTLATGRCCEAVRELIEEVPINAPALITNGVVIYDFENERIVRSVGIDQAAKEIVFSLLDGFGDKIGVKVHSRDKVADLNLTHEIHLNNKYENLHPADWDKEQIKNAEWSKLLFAFEDISDREKLKEKLINCGVCAEQIIFTNAYLDDGIHNYLEVVPLGENKGTGVRVLAKELGIQNEKVFGIGDYYNDIPLLTAVGCAGVASGAPEEITALADFVSCSAAEGAVGKFIDYIEERMLAK